MRREPNPDQLIAALVMVVALVVMFGCICAGGHPRLGIGSLVVAKCAHIYMGRAEARRDKLGQEGE